MVIFKGKVLNDVKTNDINLATDTFEPNELVTMKSIESWIKQASTSKVELIDMIQNACWYIDSSESEFKNTFIELYYNLELEKTTDDSFIICRMSRFGKDTKPLKFSEEYTVKSVSGGTHRVFLENII